MSQLLHDTHFWLVIAFTIMLVLLVIKTHKIVNSILSQKIYNISDEINNSVNVLNEANILLTESSDNLSSIENQLTENYLRSKKEDDTYYEKYITNLNFKIKSDKKNFENYLNIQYNSSILDHKDTIINESLNNVIEHVNKNIDNKKHKQMIDESIEILSRKL